MLKKIFFLLFFATNVYADDCLQYKITPNVTVKNPEWTKTVVLSDNPMDEYNGKYISFKLHGITETNLQELYDIDFGIVQSGDGFCIFIKGANVSIGYENFSVKIDKSHKVNSCSYNAVLNHEEKHIDAYLSVLEDLKPDIESSVFNAMNSVMPMFAKDVSTADLMVDELYKKIENHPDIILIRQKINAAVEIRNKRIDQNETNEELNKC